MTLKGQIQDDTRSAMKAGDKGRLRVLRMIMAAIKQVEVDKRIQLDDGAVLGVLDKMVKQRRDSIEQFRAGGREDLARIEAGEIAVIETYLPEQLSDAELDRLIEQAIRDSGATTMRDMGKVMGILKAEAQGRADMGQVGARVKQRLAGG